jgi:hypothetical protein
MGVQESSIFCSEARKQIDFNDIQSEIAMCSIPRSFDPESDANDEINLHDEKQPSLRYSTEAGIQIDVNDEQLESAHGPI